MLRSVFYHLLLEMKIIIIYDFLADANPFLFFSSCVSEAEKESPGLYISWH